MPQEIALTKGLFAVVDDLDYALLSSVSWFAARASNGMYYARRELVIDGRRQSFWMHREIMAPPAGFVVHHIDRNSLNNRRENLVVLSPSEHTLIHPEDRNLPPSQGRPWSHGTSRFAGVCWNRAARKWHARFVQGKNRTWLGAFTDERAAALAYNRAAIAALGESARLNQVEEEAPCGS